MARDVNSSKLLTVLIVYLAFLLDNILLTVVVPIIPDYLFASEATEEISEVLGNGSIVPKSLSHLQLKFEDLEKEYGPVGVLLSSKALIQLIANPIVGYLTEFLGYNIPFVIGSTNLLVACLLFAYGQSYSCLLIARSLHGIASACVAVSGMCLIADLYQDSKRSKLMGIVLGSVAMGVLFGYPLGGILYDFIGKTAPFLVIAIMIAACIVLQIYYLDIKYNLPLIIKPQQSEISRTSWYELMVDVPVSIIFGAIWITTTAMAVLEPCLPLWMMANIHPPPEKWQLGTVFIPDSLGYLLGTNCTGLIAENFKKWKLGLVAMVLVGVCATLIPSASTVKQLAIPHLGLGLGIGILDASLVPVLANLVDSKYGSHYGAVYALQQIAVSMAYSLGPLLGGETINVIGFPWLMRLIGIVNIIYCPLLLMLMKDEDRGEMPPLVNNSSNSVSYNTEGQLERISCSKYKRFEDEEE